MGKPVKKHISGDAEWKEFSTRGSEKALESIYNLFYDRLYTYGRKLRFSSHLTEDAIQNVFVNLLRSRRNLRHIENIFAYLVSSLRNELLRLDNRENTFSLVELSLVNKADDNGREDEIISLESDMKISDTLTKIIRKLPPAQQEIIFLRFYAGLEYEEIAGILSITVESCRTSVYRSLKAIRKDVESLKQAGVLFYL
jgi:RNA polymerase sigma factor (sigma-70 family)